ncbi:MAG: 2-dehydropantoate 2-reductase [Armatimonadota bacterium]|nr:2-dehydropantoate 2-reductase [Armatimonadota bacterium]
MKIAVYGAGGVGGYFGGRLALAGADVHLIARGAHLEALGQRGLRVRSLAGDFEVRLPATDEPERIGPCDAVLFCVKSYDTEEAASRLPPLLREGTAVVSLQNGVDNEEKIARAVGWEHVLGGAAFVFATIASPGVIAHTAGPGRIVFGEMDGTRSERATRLLEACRRAGVDAELHSDIRTVLWDKFAFICAQAGLTAAVRLPIGEIRGAPASWAMFRRIVEEVCAVAAAEGVPLPQDTADRHQEFAQRLEPDSLSSLHHDMTSGRRMELEALHGTVVRLARKHGIDVPMSQAVYAILEPWARRNAAGGA